MTLTVTSYENGENLSQTVLNRPINEIVDYVNNQGFIKGFSNPFEVTVGNSGADFTTIQDACNYMSQFSPTLTPPPSAANGAGHSATITLKSGFVINESTVLVGVNLGWCVIKSEDPTVQVNVGGLNYQSYDGVSAFYASNATPPSLDISLVASSSRNNATLLYLINGSRAGIWGGNSWSGINGTASYTVFVTTGSFLYADGSTFDSVNVGPAGDFVCNSGSVGSISMFAGGRAVVTGNTGAGNYNIPTNTVTPNGIIFE